jgi:hypothetical protein
MIENKNSELNRIREIYRYVIFKYVFIPRCISGLVVLIIEFVLFVYFTDDILSGEFTGLIVAVSVFSVYSIGLSIYLWKNIKIEDVETDYTELEKELKINKIKLEIWDRFSVDKNDISVCAHYLILIGYKILDIISNAFFIWMSISVTDGRTLSQLVSFAGAVFLINAAECILDVFELVLLCINCCCQCYSGGRTTIHPEQELNQEAKSERRKAADVETELKVIG